MFNINREVWHDEKNKVNCRRLIEIVDYHIFCIILRRMKVRFTSYTR